MLILSNSEGTLDGITLNGNIDSSQQNSDLRVLGGLVLNGTITLGNSTSNSFGRLHFGDGNIKAGAVTGHGTILFAGNNDVNQIENASSLTGADGTFTIGPDIKIHGHTGSLKNSLDTGTTINQGTITADTAGGRITIGGTRSSHFVNQGTINVTTGILNLNNSTTLSGLGALSRTGGTINLGGVLDLQGNTWNLNAAAGSWNLTGGTVKNGTITETGGSVLILSNSEGTLDGITLNGNIDSSQQNSDLRVLGGLVLNGTITLGNSTSNSFGRLHFGDGNIKAGAVTGHGTILFAGNNDVNQIENASSLTGADGTFTIGPDIKIHGHTGSLKNVLDTGTTINQGAITADTAGGRITIGGTRSSHFVNQGTINVTTGILSLNNSTTLSGLGALSRTGGTINLGGVLDLQGNTWNLNAAAGSWNLTGGTVKNGTITETGGSVLILSNSEGTLDGITLNGNIDSSQQNSDLRVLGGLVLNGTITLGNSTSNSFGRLHFGDGNIKAGAVTGHGTILFAGNNDVNQIENASSLTGADGTFTIGPDIKIHGHTGSLKNSLDTGTTINQGTITADTAGGRITIGGARSSHFVNQGTINVLNGSTLNVDIGFTQTATAIFYESDGSAIQTGSNLISLATNPVVFRPSGTVELNGNKSEADPQFLEAMGQDVGPKAIGFLGTNFAIGSLNLSNNTFVKLVDQSDNVPGAGTEAVYANSVTIPSGSTLDLSGRKLYTRALQKVGDVKSGNIVVIPDSGELSLGIPTPGEISVSGQTDEWTFFSRAGNAVSVTLNTGNTGTPAPVSPQLNWGRLQVLKADNTVLATVSSVASGQIVTINNLVTPSDGIYKIRISAEQSAAHISSIGHYIVTGWNSTPNVRQLDLNKVETGKLNTPFSQDDWTFSAVASQQVKFNLLSATSPEITFTLSGPNGFPGFTDIADDSTLINIPFTGNYTLRVHSLSNATGSYSFKILQTFKTNLTLGGSYNAPLAPVRHN